MATIIFQVGIESKNYFRVCLRQGDLHRADESASGRIHLSGDMIGRQRLDALNIVSRPGLQDSAVLIEGVRGGSRGDEAGLEEQVIG